MGINSRGERSPSAGCVFTWDIQAGDESVLVKETEQYSHEPFTWSMP